MKTFLSAFVAVAVMSAGTLYAQEKAALGVTMSDSTPGGVLVTNVVEGSPAARIGLQAGDRIMVINNQKTNNYRDVVRIVGASPANVPIELTVLRGGWRTKLKVELGSAPAVFTPAQTFVLAPRPTHVAEGAPPEWSPNYFDDGSAGASASYGGGGY
jgi:membrane-associated protease RseP (regulator of RpoE activity)